MPDHPKCQTCGQTLRAGNHCDPSGNEHTNDDCHPFVAEERG